MSPFGGNNSSGGGHRRSRSTRRQEMNYQEMPPIAEDSIHNIGNGLQNRHFFEDNTGGGVPVRIYEGRKP